MNETDKVMLLLNRNLENTAFSVNKLDSRELFTSMILSVQEDLLLF